MRLQHFELVVIGKIVLSQSNEAPHVDLVAIDEIYLSQPKEQGVTHWTYGHWRNRPVPV